MEAKMRTPFEVIGLKINHEDAAKVEQILHKALTSVSNDGMQAIIVANPNGKLDWMFVTTGLTPNNSGQPRRASRSAAPRGWAFDPAAKIADELFRLGGEPNSPTHRIEFRGGRYTTDKSQERGQGGLNQIAFADWLARALERHLPNPSMTGGEPAGKEV